MSAESEMPRQLDRRNLLLGGAAALAAGGLSGRRARRGGRSSKRQRSSARSPGRRDRTHHGRSGRASELAGHHDDRLDTGQRLDLSQRVHVRLRAVRSDAKKTWGGSGVYSGGTSTTMRATVEVPAGALVREVEYYIFNNSGSNVVPDSWLYTPGQGTIASIGATATVASTGTITANRVLPPSSIGPYPLGSRLLLGLSTPTTGTVQINGARVGFSEGGAASGLLDAPIRAYDSARRRRPDRRRQRRGRSPCRRASSFRERPASSPTSPPSVVPASAS